MQHTQTRRTLLRPTFARLFSNALMFFAISLLSTVVLAGCTSPDQPVSSDQPGQQPPATGTGTEIIGVVTDENGKPLEEVGIAVTKGTSAVPEMLVLTDQDGKYSWGVPAGTYTLTARKDGYQDVSKEVQVKEGEQAKLDFQLKPAP